MQDRLFAFLEEPPYTTEDCLLSTGGLQGVEFGTGRKTNQSQCKGGISSAIYNSFLKKSIECRLKRNIISPSCLAKSMYFF